MAPIYVIFGEHDLAREYLSEIKRVLRLSGAKVLSNEAEWISFDDPSAGFWLKGLCGQVADFNQKDELLSKIELPSTSETEPKILLAHHPEYFEQYLINKHTRPNLILSGHTLGGHIILPRIGEVYAKGQGQNPTYDFGIFTSEKHPDSRMIITSGVGNDRLPIRVNNRPEIVVIEFE